MSNLTRSTYLLLTRIAALNPEAGEIGAGMLANLVIDANRALLAEKAPRFRVLSNEYDFNRNEVVYVLDMHPTRENDFTVEAFSVDRPGTSQRIPDAELEPLDETFVARQHA